MTRVEQHQLIETLHGYAHLMRGRDLDEFEMMRKRDRDDEELDAMRRKRLLELFERYVPERYRT
jgi:predicted deacetylase